MTRVHQTAVMICAGLLSASLLASLGNAQDLPSEGKFSITFVLVNPTPFKGVANGKDREIISNNTLATAVNDAGSGLLHNMAGRCISFSTVDRGAKTVEFRGYCQYADRSGDLVFEEFTTPPSPLGTPPKIAGKWVGGTGKYAGLTGDFEITNSGPLTADGPFQTAGKKIGSYKIVK